MRDFWSPASDDDWRTSVRALWDAGRACDALTPMDALARIAEDLAADEVAADDLAEAARLPGLDAADLAVLRFVSILTLRPHATTRADAELHLRTVAGLDDAGILDVVQVAACFAYMNRLADGTGVLTMPKQSALQAMLFSQDEIAAHQAWGARTA